MRAKRKRPRSRGAGNRRRQVKASAGQSRRSRSRRKHQRAARAAILPVKLSAAIVTVSHGGHAAGAVMRELESLPLQEIIAVVSGGSDSGYHTVSGLPNVTVVYHPEPLDAEVGRAIGAAMTRADMLLFVSGDEPIESHKLAKFLAAVQRGADIALCDRTSALGRFSEWDNVSRIQSFLNRSLGRADLGAATMAEVPYAISRRALDAVGIRKLANPPRAHAAAISGGMKVVLCPGVPVMNRDKLRELAEGPDNPVTIQRIGDYYEALREAQDRSGKRLCLVDAVRRRDMLGGVP